MKKKLSLLEKVTNSLPKNYIKYISTENIEKCISSISKEEYNKNVNSIISQESEIIVKGRFTIESFSNRINSEFNNIRKVNDSATFDTFEFSINDESGVISIILHYHIKQSFDDYVIEKVYIELCSIIEDKERKEQREKEQRKLYEQLKKKFEKEDK